MFTNTFNPNMAQQPDEKFFNDNCRSRFFKKRNSFRRAFATQFGDLPAVNIEENEEAYTLYVYAAGRKKEDFHLSLQDKILTVSYTEEERTEKQFLYLETELANFERSFQLNTAILSEQISAAYIDGVLTISLPKDPEAKTEGQNITIA